MSGGPTRDAPEHSTPWEDIWVPEVPWLGIALGDLRTGLVLRANQTFLELVGYDARDVSEGRVSIRGVTAADSMATTEAALRQLAARGTMTLTQKTYLRKDGQPRHAWVTGTAVPHREGLTMAYILDMTAQYATIQALKDSEERATRFAQASFEGLFLHDHGIIIDVNDVLAAMFGTTREYLIGRPAYEFADPSCHEMLRQNIARQHEQPYEVLGRRMDGTTFPIEVLGKPLPVDGKVIRVTAVRDLTERKRTEAALRHAETALREAQRLESLGLLAGGIAHDFNNLLAIIVGYTSIATRRLPDDSQLKAALVEIERAATRAADLTRQMLVYSGRSPKMVDEVQLDPLVREMSSLVSASFSKKIQLVLELAPELPCVLADRTQMQQVILNLLTNAAEAIGDQRGTITVRTRVAQLGEGEVPSPTPGGTIAAGSYVVLEVSDTGMGMDQGTAQRIFDPFFSTKGTGRGLGLSTMLGILRGHAGAISVETQPGQGSTLRVYLPARAGAPAKLDASASEATSTNAAPHGRTVLVVDDELPLRGAIRELLESEGYRVHEASDGAAALRMFREHRGEIDLVILDLVMPELDGREVLEELRAIDPRVAVILTSGFDAHEALDRARGKVAGFLPKPFLGAELVRLVNQTMAQR